MKSNSILACPFFNNNASWFIGFCVALLLLTAAAASAQIEGFTEPFRKIELSSDETGAIATLSVEEGQFIGENDIVCKLDNSVQAIQVEIAKHLADASSQVKVAEETFKKRGAIHKRIHKLLAKGHATDSELLRSEMELSIAKARFLSAKEDEQVRQIEYRRAILQLERRTIRAPFAGVVSKIHKRAGEYISPMHPEVVSLIQIDRLIAKFNVPSSQARIFEPGKTFELTMVNGESVKATVYSVGVFTEAQSGTVEIKLVVENAEHAIRAGEFITLNI